jgi:hypothetical protein
MEDNIISKWIFKYGNEIVRKNTEEKLEKLMKEQEIKEVAERYAEDDPYNRYEKCFINGAKWQQERKYSEKEIGLLNKMFELYWYENNSQHPDNLEEWELSKKIIEQFKKK